MEAVDQTRLDEYAIAIGKAEESLVNFRHIMLVNGDEEVAAAPHHYRWSDILLHGKGNDAFEGFRESGKTQYVLRSFLLYCLMFPSTKRDYIVIIKKNSRLAAAKLREIQREYESNPALRHNCVKVIEQTADSFEVVCKDKRGKEHSIRIETYGKGASIRGLAHVDKRPKIVIIDDPQDAEDAFSPTVQQSDWDWFLSDVMFLGQKTRIFAIGNNLGETCILERIGTHADELGFSFERIPALIDNQSAWASKFTTADIEAEKRNFERLGKLDIWLREKMCVAVSDETRIFRSEDFRYFNLKLAPQKRAESNAWILCDPAVSMKDSSDYRAFVTIFCDKNNDWFLPECSYGRWDAMKTIDEMFRLVQTWEVRDVCIEEGIYKSSIEPFLLQEMKKRNVFFNVIPLKHGNKRKEDRIRMLQPRFKSHAIYFPEPGQSQWTAEMEAELLAFTMQGMKGLHDDLIDALAYAEQVVRPPYHPSMHNKNLPRQCEDNYDPFK